MVLASTKRMVSGARRVPAQATGSANSNRPGTGATDFAFLLAHIDAIGYRGHVGCEYMPATTTEAGLDWLLPWRAPTAA